MLSDILAISNYPYERIQDVARYLILHLPFLFFSIKDFSITTAVHQDIRKNCVDFAYELNYLSKVLVQGIKGV